MAFENGLLFPLHVIIKRVLQHFNVCPFQLFPNFWGFLVRLLVILRDKGLSVPSIALLLDFFSVKEDTEGFLYIFKCSIAKLIIFRPSVFPQVLEGTLFVLSAAIIGSTIPLTKRTHLAFQLSGLLPRTYVSYPALWSDQVFKGCRIFLTLLWSLGF